MYTADADDAANDAGVCVVDVQFSVVAHEYSSIARLITNNLSLRQSNRCNSVFVVATTITRIDTYIHTYLSCYESAKCYTALNSSTFGSERFRV